MVARFDTNFADHFVGVDPWNILRERNDLWTDHYEGPLCVVAFGCAQTAGSFFDGAKSHQRDEFLCRRIR